jgi:hypothetical protein
LFRDPTVFRKALEHDITCLERRASRLGLKPAVRLNGTSDLSWEKMPKFSSLFAQFPNVQFYDYTKDHRRAVCNAQGMHPANYHLTYSASERDTDDDILCMRQLGISVAIVTRALASCTVNGDLHDLRFLDPPGSLIALSPKGLAKRDTTGFVRFAISRG